MGLRWGKLLGLRWCDVDFDFATLSVVQTLQQLKNGQYILREAKANTGATPLKLSIRRVIL